MLINFEFFFREFVQVIFRDFKTSNVLLDEDYNPKLSDFGLARLGPEGDKSHVTTGVCVLFHTSTKFNELHKLIHHRAVTLS